MSATEEATETIRVKVTVDTDELRRWADHHADRGHHGVAHVLYKAAQAGESLTEQALREARAEGASRALLDAADQLDRDGMKRLGAHTVKQWLRQRAREVTR